MKKRRNGRGKGCARFSGLELAPAQLRGAAGSARKRDFMLL
jgi:hypothetical protein